MPLYSLTPEHFHEADSQLAEREGRREFTKLHGDGEMNTAEANRDMAAQIVGLQAEIADLRAQLLLKQGEIDYLEDALEWERDQRRQEGGEKP